MPENEARRLQALHNLDVLDSPPDAAFDDLTLIASRVCSAPIALVSLIDRARQWFKSAVGLSVKETPRDIAFCAHAVAAGPGLFVVPDAAADPRFSRNPLVASDPRIRFYAGAPLVTSDGFALGTLCVIDVVPRDLALHQKDVLLALARQVVSLLELRRVQTALRESESQFRQILDNIRDVVWLSDPQTQQPLYLSRSFESLSGIPRDVLYQRPDAYVAAIHPDDRPRALEAFQQQREYEIEFRIVRPDGAVRWIWNRAFPIRDEKGGLVRMAGIAADITGRKQAEQSREAELEATFENTSDGLVVTDRQGRMTNYNRRFVQMWKIPESIVASGDTQAAIAHVLDQVKDPAAFASKIQELLGNFDAESFDTLEFKDGRVFERTSRPQRVGGRVWNFRDVTQRRQLEEQFRQAQKMEAVGRLAGGVAHDFNNLLTAILGFSGMALDQLPPGSPLRSDLEQIRTAGERAASLTRQLLLFSRRQPMKMTLVDVNAVVGGLQKMLKRIIGENVDLSTSLDPSSGRILADAGLLEQVLMNLVVNARDAMPQGGTVKIATQSIGPRVALSVVDTGVGMDAATRGRLFEPFFTTKEPGKGTGLGLSTVYGIVKRCGGDIEVESEPGQGSTFRILFPRAQGEGAAGIEPPPAADGTETILVVEDDDGVRATIVQALRSRGYTILPARSGAEALNICRSHPGPISLMLTDMVMPQMSGLDLSQQAVALRPSMKVVFMSGYSDAVGLLGDQAFLQKPFSPDDLARLLRRHL